jgi:RNA polymerase primary sigma factor
MENPMVEPNSSSPILESLLKDIRKTKPLSRKEESKLWKAIRNGNQKAKDKMISSNLRFILEMALKYQNQKVPLLDLFNEGVLGMMRAVDSFKPHSHYKFITYAVWWIRAYMISHMHKHTHLVRLPQEKAQSLIKLKSLPGAEAQAFIEEKNLQDFLIFTDTALSINRPMGEAGAYSLEEKLASEESLLEAVQENELPYGSMLQEMTAHLDKREKIVLTSLFGQNDKDAKTLRETGQLLNISHERVRQIKEAAFEKIRSLADFARFKTNFKDLVQPV